MLRRRREPPMLELAAMSLLRRVSDGDAAIQKRTRSMSPKAQRVWGSSSTADLDRRASANGHLPYTRRSILSLTIIFYPE
jgi:hypothetical protein